MAEGINLGKAFFTITPEFNAAAAEAAAKSYGQTIGRAMAQAALGTGQFREQIKGAEADHQSLASSIVSGMSNVSSVIGRVSTSVGLLSFGFQLVGQNLTRYVTQPVMGFLDSLITNGFKTAETLENAQVALGSLLGPQGYSSSDVKALLDRLSDFAVKSPVFTIDTVTEAIRNMVGAGLGGKESEQVLNALNSIFITFGVTGERAQNAMLGVNQVFSKGKAQSEELTKQIGQSVPIWELLSEATGKSQAELRKMVQAGDVSSEMFAQWVIQIGKLPQITAGAAGGVHTFSAIWAQFTEQINQDVAQKLLANFPQIEAALDSIRPLIMDVVNFIIDHIPVVVGKIKEWADKIGELHDKWQQLKPDVQDLIGKIVLVITLLGPASSAFGLFGIAGATAIRAISLALNPIGLVLTGIALLLIGIGLLFYELYKNSKDFRDGVDAFVKAVDDGWNQKIKPALKDLSDEINQKLKPALDGLLKAIGFKDWKEFGEWLGKVFVQDVLQVIEVINGIVLAITFLAHIITGLILTAKQFGKDWSATWDLAANTMNDFKQIAMRVWDAFTNTVDHGTSMFKKMVTDAFTETVDIVKNVWDKLKSVVADPLKATIRLYDHGIEEPFNMIAEKLGISTRLPYFDPDSVVHFAEGGRIPGSQAAGDWIPFFGTAGERVLTVEENKMWESMFGSARHYASGGILGDAEGWLASKASSLIPGNILNTLRPLMDAVKGADLGSGFFSEVGHGALGSILGGITDKLSPLDIVRSLVGGGGSGSAAPAGSVRDWIVAGLSLVGRGSDQRWINGLYTIAMRESAGNPNAINLWDSNAMAGHPSKGLLQFIDSTFNRYALAGHTNIWNPIDQVIADGRPGGYIDSAYGGIGNVQQANPNLAPMGYDSGGLLPPGMTLTNNRTGKPEAVFTSDQMDRLGGDVFVSVFVDGVEHLARVEVDKQSANAVRRLRAGNKR